jgi:ADP-heptose:LPS heptosyltransferase
LKNELRAQRFDLSIDFHGLAKSAMLVKLANAKYKIASSSTNGMREFSWLISKQIKNPNPDAHCIERHLSVAKYLNCDEILEYPIAISDSDFESVKEKLSRHGRNCGILGRHCGLDPQSPTLAEIAGQARNDASDGAKGEGVNLNKIIALHLGGGWISRRWAIDRFALLAQKLKKDLGASIVIIGGKEGGSSEKGLNEELISLAKDTEICDMTAQFNLKELCAFFKLCKLFIGNEAGPMHIATALNIPSIALLGPTNAKRTGPYKGQTQIIQRSVPCQPCRNRNCKNPICMQNIAVEEVFEAAKQKYENSNH